MNIIAWFVLLHAFFGAFLGVLARGPMGVYTYLTTNKKYMIVRHVGFKA